MLVPITYYQLGLQKNGIDLAHVLGWCVELVRASRIVCDQTIAETINTSNINRPVDHKGKPGAKRKLSWPAKHQLGTRAFSDAMTLDNSVGVLIRKKFGDDPRTSHFLERFDESFNMTTLGRNLAFMLKRTSKELDGNIDLTKFTLTHYKTLIKTRNTFTNYCLPFSLALHLDGIHQRSVHEAAHLILHEMGFLTQITKDFANCYSIGDGSDIAKGKLTWLITVACQRANDQQKRILKECYGDEVNPESTERVVKVYEDLKMKKSLQHNIDDCKNTILSRIQQISKIDAIGVTPDFFFRLMESMRMNDI